MWKVYVLIAFAWVPVCTCPGNKELAIVEQSLRSSNYIVTHERIGTPTSFAEGINKVTLSDWKEMIRTNRKVHEDLDRAHKRRKKD